MRALLHILIAALVLGPLPALPASTARVDTLTASSLDPLTEYRYCGAPRRNPDGSIHRSAAVLAAFQRIHPCPSTGKTTGACPGWQMNHDRSLACGGCDAVSNLSWLPVDTKTCTGPHCTDRYERSINALVPPIADTAACTNKVIP
ncbi:MAG: hypothetical protein AB9M53_01190 [Leptothrix sp. (in: b-proteobacteria)]